MKALILCGSGNRSGSTYATCQVFASEMVRMGHSAEVADLSDYSVKDCIGCRFCRAGGGCNISDDMDTLCRKMESAEVLVFASPIRFSGLSSIMKRFVDRLNPYWYSERAHSRYSCAILCAGSTEPKFSNALSELKAASNTLGMEWLGELCIRGTDCSEPDKQEISRFSEAVAGLKNV